MGKNQNRPISLAHQAGGIKKNFPDWKITFSGGKVMVAKGVLKPTGVSSEYHVKITYRLNNAPKVHVLSPGLYIREGAKRIPHTYKEKNALCLYYPKFKQWTKYKYIHSTIIPWASLWLYFYETWHITGEWLGGGIHPPNG